MELKRGVPTLDQRLAEAESRIAALQAENAVLRQQLSAATLTLPASSLVLESISDGFIAVDREFRCEDALVTRIADQDAIAAHLQGY